MSKKMIVTLSVSGLGAYPLRLAECNAVALKNGDKIAVDAAIAQRMVAQYTPHLQQVGAPTEGTLANGHWELAGTTTQQPAAATQQPATPATEATTTPAAESAAADDAEAEAADEEQAVQQDEQPKQEQDQVEEKQVETATPAETKAGVATNRSMAGRQKRK